MYSTLPLPHLMISFVFHILVYVSPLPSTSDVALCHYDACNPNSCSFTYASAATIAPASVSSSYSPATPYNLPLATFVATKKK